MFVRLKVTYVIVYSLSLWYGHDWTGFSEVYTKNQTFNYTLTIGAGMGSNPIRSHFC